MPRGQKPGSSPARSSQAGPAPDAPAAAPSSEAGPSPTGVTPVTAPRLLRPRKHTVCTALAFIRPFLSLAPSDQQRDVVLACSGGADSSALVLAAAATPWLAGRCLVAHIRHDLRPEEQTLADQNRSEALAAAVGLPFVSVAVGCRDDAALQDGGNLEGSARRARYEALVQIARQLGASRVLVLTGHTQRDQAETVLMRLLRGAGPRGLAAMARSRSLARGVLLMRPFLALPAEATADACSIAGWTPAVDATNADTSRFRAAVRHRALPLLEELAPGATARLAAAAGLQRLAVNALRAAAAELPTGAKNSGERRVARQSLSGASPAVLAVWIERQLAALAQPVGTTGETGELPGENTKRPVIRRDRRTLLRACQAIAGGVNDRRLYRFGAAGLGVTGKWVVFRWLSDAEREQMKRR